MSPEPSFEERMRAQARAGHYEAFLALDDSQRRHFIESLPEAAHTDADGLRETLEGLARKWRGEAGLFSEAVSSRVKRKCAKELTDVLKGER